MNEDPKRDSIAAGLCIIGAGVIGIAGAILIGMGEIATLPRGSDIAVTGFFILLVAAMVLAFGLVRLFKK